MEEVALKMLEMLILMAESVGCAVEEVVGGKGQSRGFKGYFRC